MALVEEAIAKTGDEGPGLVCFRESYVPGYRGFGRAVIADIDLGLASGLFASRCKYACDDAQLQLCKKS